jgi:hypothetical protein
MEGWKMQELSRTDSETTDEVLDAEVVNEEEALINRYLTMSVDEFASNTVKTQNAILFVMVRALLGEARVLSDRSSALDDPERMQQVVDNFMGALGGGNGGGMLSGLMGGFLK